MKKFWLLTTLCVLLLFLAACTSGSQSGGDLTGKVWAVTELMGNPPVAGTGISAEFSEDGKVGGSSGCNRYNGTYTVSGNNITFASPMASTMMMCEQAIMDQESAYLGALGEAKTFAVKGDQLTLSGEDGPHWPFTKPNPRIWRAPVGKQVPTITATRLSSVFWKGRP